MQLKIKINGDTWKVKVVTAKQMRAQQSSENEFAGLCVPSEKTIYIDEDSVDLETVTHELYHGYFSYLFLDDTNNLSLLDIEEITANFFCNRAAEILKKSRQVYKKLQKGE